MGKGNSFANGQSTYNGASVSGGPYSGPLAQGWDIRPASIWDHLEPRILY